MPDDRPSIPSAYFLGQVAYNAWCDAHRDEPTTFYADLSESERAVWQRIATKVAERVRKAIEGA